MQDKKRFIAMFVFFLAKHLRLREFIAIAKLVSLLYYNLNIRNRATVKNNMKFMHIKFSIKQYLYFAQFLSENIYLYHNEINTERFSFYNLDILSNAVKEGKKVFLISVHYGNWEMTGQALQKMGYNLSVIYEQKNEWIYNYIDRIRIKYGLKLIERDVMLDSIKNEIREKRILSFLIDHRSTNMALKQHKFLGIETDHPYGWFNLIKKLEVKPICIFTQYENNKHQVYFFEPINYSYENYYQYFEKRIKKDIYQYDFYNQMWKDISV